MNEYSKQEISELLHRTAYLVDQKDLAGLAGCFHEDATFHIEIAGVEQVSKYSGHSQIMQLMQGTMNAQSHVGRHVISNVWYESVEDDRATVVSYMILAATANGETKVLTTGVYRDDVVKAVDDDGGWVLMNRFLHLDSSP